MLSGPGRIVHLGDVDLRGRRRQSRADACMQVSWRRRKERNETYRQTNCSTLSSGSMKPRLTMPVIMAIQITGAMSILPIASARIAPRGIRAQFSRPPMSNRASAAPRQIRPRGTDALPAKVAMSSMKFNGGRLSGAVGWKDG